jgi:hypothetical protein
MYAVFRMKQFMLGENPYLVSLMSSLSNLHTGMLDGLEPPFKRINQCVVVSTMHKSGLDIARGLFVMADGTILTCAGYSIRVLLPSNFEMPAATFVGANNTDDYKNGEGVGSGVEEVVGSGVEEVVGSGVVEEVVGGPVQ